LWSAPELETIAFFVTAIKNGNEECSQVLEEPATSSGQWFWKSFKKRLKIRITLEKTYKMSQMQ
jgi:hypothetical protein